MWMHSCRGPYRRTFHSVLTHQEKKRERKRMRKRLRIREGGETVFACVCVKERDGGGREREGGEKESGIEEERAMWGKKERFEGGREGGREGKR